MADYSNYFMPTQGERLWTEGEKRNTQYKEFKPSQKLSPYVSCYWISRTEQAADKPHVSRIITGGCMDLIFNMKEIAQGKSGAFSGLLTRPRINTTVEGNEHFGIRFWPGEVIPLIGDAADCFTDQLIPLDEIWGNCARLISEELFLLDTTEARIRYIEALLANMLVSAKAVDANIKNALSNIYMYSGNLPVKTIAQGLNVSQRHLDRIFKSWVGTNPKTYSNIIRFQRIIRYLNATPSSKLIDLAIDCGYYDQPHFIRTFKAFYGKTPGRL